MKSGSTWKHKGKSGETSLSIGSSYLALLQYVPSEGCYAPKPIVNVCHQTHSFRLGNALSKSTSVNRYLTSLLLTFSTASLHPSSLIERV